MLLFFVKQGGGGHIGTLDTGIVFYWVWNFVLLVRLGSGWDEGVGGVIIKCSRCVTKGLVQFKEGLISKTCILSFVFLQ